jgi:hypothetical protein
MIHLFKIIIHIRLRLMYRINISYSYKISKFASGIFHRTNEKKKKK